MKNHIKFIGVVLLALFTWGASPLSIEVSQANSNNPLNQHETFTIEKISTNMGKKEVILILDHTISYPTLFKWYSKRKPKISPRLDIDWNISYLTRNKITLTGDFKIGQKYSIVFPPNFKVDGRIYKRTTSSFTIEPPADIEFFNDRDVIERDSRQLLHLNLTNVGNLLIRTVNVPPILLPQALDISHSDNLSWKRILDKLNSPLKANMNLENLPNEFLALVGTPIEGKQVFNTPKTYKSKPYSVPLSYRANSDKGAIELVRVEVEGENSKQARPYRLIRITDLGITYKRSHKNLLVWTTSLNQGVPLEGIKIFGVAGDGTIFYLGDTNSKGALLSKSIVLDGIKLNGNGYRNITRFMDLNEIRTLIAYSENDATYIKIDEAFEFRPTEFPNANDNSNKGKLFKGSIFTERGIYKPGDTIFFKGTIREYSDGEILPPKLEALIKINNSRGETVFTSTHVSSDFGTLSGEFVLKPHFPMGTYTLTMETGEKTIASQTFELQNYRAPRHKTQISFKKDSIADNSFINLTKNSDTLRVKLTGQYYVGGPLKHAQVRWKIFQGRTGFKLKEYDNFNFGNDGQDEALIESSESVLDEKGQLEFKFPIDSQVSTGRRSLIIVASIIDFDGRVATSKAVYQNKPEYLIGISKHSKNIEVGIEHPFKMVVLDSERNLVQEGLLKVSVLKKGWNYIRKRNAKGEVYWNWQKHWRKVYSTNLSINSDLSTFSFNTSYGGDYLVTSVFTKNGNTFSSGVKVNVKGGYYYNNRTDSNQPYEKLNLWSDKSVYSPGEIASIGLRPNRDISAYLVTQERDGVLDYQVLSPKNIQSKISIPLTNTHPPNLYVSVLGTVPRKEFPRYPSAIDDEAPSFQFGTIKLQVLKNSDQLNVKIKDEADELITEPGSTRTFKISVKDKNGVGKVSELAVGVVDERILALTGYKTPDLDQLAQFSIPLRVSTADIRNNLSRQTPLKLIWNRPVTGGGGV